MVDQAEVDAVKAFAIEMSRDPREGLTARQRALMACIVIPQPIQQWMVEAGAVDPLLDSIEKTILAAEENAKMRAALIACRDFIDGMSKPLQDSAYTISSYHPCRALVDQANAALKD